MIALILGIISLLITVGTIAFEYRNKKEWEKVCRQKWTYGLGYCELSIGLLIISFGFALASLVMVFV